MKSLYLLIVTLILILPQNVSAEKPVLVADYTIDTSLYEYNSIYKRFVPDPFSNAVSYFFCAYRKKNSNQVDIYSCEGKCGTSIIPWSNSFDHGSDLTLSRTVLDDDDGWESVINYYAGSDSVRFKVFDDNGTELLSDLGECMLGCDGNSTYVVKSTFGSGYGIPRMKAWRFRTNIMNTSSPSLSKTKAVQTLPMQIYGLSSGDYRVTLSPSNGNQISFQMFDLMGRCVLSKQINNITSPVSFIIPEDNVPKSPFIAKVNDGNQSFYKKQIPVR